MVVKIKTRNFQTYSNCRKSEQTLEGTRVYKRRGSWMPDITSVNMCGIQFYSYRPDITLFAQAVVSACRILGFTFRKKWNISRCMKSLKFRYRQGVRKHVIGLTEVQMAVSLCWQKHIWNLKKTRQSM